MVGILLWPYLEWGRFLYPVLPFLLLYGYFGTSSVLATAVSWPVRSTYRQGVTVCVWSVVAVLVLAPNLFENARRIWLDPMTRYVPRIAPGASWLMEHTPEESVVLSEYPFRLYLYSGRQTVQLHHHTTCSLQQIANADADYVFVGPAQGWTLSPSPTSYASDCLLPLLLREDQEFRLAFALPEKSLWVFEVLHPRASGRSLRLLPHVVRLVGSTEGPSAALRIRTSTSLLRNDPIPGPELARRFSVEPHLTQAHERFDSVRDRERRGPA
jgi:hypothetical protein